MPPKAGQTKAKAGVSTRRPRGSLSREEIVRGAYELVEMESVDELSMPRLGRHLGVGVTSIYWYFRSKEELLDALTEQAARRFNEILPEFSGYDWDEHLRQYFRAFRRVFIENPSLCDLVVLRAPMQSQQAMVHYFARLDKEIGVLVQAGFSTEEAVRAYMTLSVYARGCVVQDRLYSMAGRSAKGEEEEQQLFAALVGRASLPVMAEAITYWSNSFATDDDFEAGLTIIIDGLRERLARTLTQAEGRTEE